MRRDTHYLQLCLLTVATLTTGAPSWAQAVADTTVNESTVATGDQPELANQLLDTIERQWWLRRTLREKGDQTGLDRATEQFVTLLHDERVDRLESFADAALLEARRASTAGNLGDARSSLTLARALDQQHGTATWESATVQRRTGEGWGVALRLYGTGLRARFGEYWARYALVAHGVSWLLCGLLLAGAASVVVILLRHAPQLVHEIDERLPSRWHPLWRQVVGWGIVLAPLAAVVLGVWALVLWAVMLVPVASRAERVLLYGWLVVMGLVTPTVQALGVITSTAISPAARVAVASAENSLRPDLMAELAALAAAHPKDATWKVLLARMIGIKHPDQSAHLLREAAQLAPNDPRIRILLGNLFYRMGKPETSAVLYREALDIDPHNVMAMFDLARAKAAAFDFPVVEEWMQKARATDPQLLARLEKTTPQEAVVDPEFGAAEVANQALSAESSPSWRKALSPLNALTLGSGAALLGALVLWLRGNQVVSRRCTRCGRARCPRCPGEVNATGELCAACEGLFTRREGLSPEARQLQVRRVDRHLRHLSAGRSLVNLLWPGLAQLHEGRTLRGLFLALLWAIALAATLWPAELLPTGPLVGIWPEGRLALIVAIATWLLAQLPTWRPAPVAQRVGR